MINEAEVSKARKWWSWIVPGVSFTSAWIYSIRNSEFVPRLAVLGSLVLLVLWSLMWLAFRLVKIRSAERATITSPGWQLHLFFFGSIVALWFPLVLRPLQAQKVEIILDVSHRMAEAFVPAGTTKFDAAKAGVLEALGQLEGNNVEVALRLINGIEYGQCDIQPETSLAVDFTRDFNRIREILRTLRPRATDKAPVVNAIDFSIDHYLAKKLFDEKFYLYSFIAGDDTCGEHLGTYLNLPMVVEHTANTQLFLIVLRGTEEERILGSLPNANLTYAESAEEVQEIVEKINNVIVTPTPTSNQPGAPARVSTNTSTDTPTSEQVHVTDTTEREEPVQEDQEPVEPDIPNTPLPPPISTATSMPPPTTIPTRPPSPTPILVITTAIPTNTPIDTATASPSNTLTAIPTTLVPPTRTPTQTVVVCESTRQPLSSASYAGTVTIHSPIQCSTTHPPATPIDTRGTYSGIPQDKVIWVFVYPPSGPYYPQSPNACSGPISSPPTQAAGNWSVPSYLGNVNDSPRPFDIVVAVVDQATSDWIGQRLHEDCTNGMYDGISAAELLQRNIDEKSFITVWTK